MKINKLSLQHGDSLYLYKNFYIKHPTLGDIVKLQGVTGDNLYELYITALITDVLDIADVLWVENKVWYEDIKDSWEFFIQQALTDSKQIMLYENNKNNKTIPSQAVLLSGTINDALKYFTGINNDFAIYQHEEHIYIVEVIKDGSILYYFSDDCLSINQHFYEMIKAFLSKISWHSQTEHQVIHGGNKRAKKYILENEYKNRMDDMKKQRSPSVTIDSITSSLIAKGISAKEIWDLPIYMIYNLYYRYMQFEEWNSTTSALNSGNIDTKKHPINWEKINWSKVID